MVAGTLMCSGDAPVVYTHTRTRTHTHTHAHTQGEGGESEDSGGTVRRQETGEENRGGKFLFHNLHNKFTEVVPGQLAHL